MTSHPFPFVLAFHVVCGFVAVAVGATALLAAKPLDGADGGWHRLAGGVFRVAQGAVIASAAVMTVLHFTPYFLGLTTGALIAFFSGLRVLGRKRPDLDRRQRATVLDWAVTLVAAAIGVWLVLQADPKGPGAVVRSTAFSVLAYAAYDLYRFVHPLGAPFSPRLWLYEHLFKMTSAYFGAVAAFSGNFLILFPEPWRQLWAVVVGQVLAVGLVVYHARRSPRADAVRARPRAA